MYPDIKDNEIQKKIFEKQEFLELNDNNKYNYEYKILDKYQEFVRRYLSPVTNYNKLILLHGTGTGKSFASISVAETHRKYNNINKCLILVKGKTSENNFKNLIIEFCNKSNLNIIKNDKFYEYDRFIKFSRKLENMTNKNIIENYSNSIIIIDEAHNIKSNDDNRLYDNIYNFLHIIKNSRILFLTATPMVDKVSEIYPLISLLTKNKIKNIDELKNNLNGIISYCDSNTNKPNIKIKGIKLPYLNFKVYVSFMKGYQLEAWNKLNTKIKKLNDKSNFDAIHKNRIYCSNIVSSKLKYGSEMKYDCIKEVDESNGKKFYLKKGIDINLNNLENYSSKFYSMLKLSTSVNGPVYVYCEDIEGSGLKILSAILYNIGYKPFFKWDNNIEPNKRFVLCTGDNDVTHNMDVLINNFCRDENKNGDYIKFFLGSKVVSESINLKNIKQIHILTPHWNLPVINQSIGRSIRKFSHQSLDLKLRSVDIYLHCSFSKKNNINYHNIFNNKKNIYEVSIDYYKYFNAQNKYNDILNIKNILKKESINKYLYYNYKTIKEIDYFTYIAFYTNNLSNYIVSLITKKINETGINYLSVNYIIQNIDIKKDIVNYVLYNKINNKCIVKDKFSQFKVITLLNNIIFLRNYNDIDNINIHLVKYINKKNEDIILNDYVSDINTNLNDFQLEVFKFNKININLIKFLFEFNINEMVSILEYSIINNKKIIKEFFSSFLINNNNILYHNLCYFDLKYKICSYSVSSGNYDIKCKTRKYNTNNKSWSYIDDKKIETSLKIENKKKLKQKDNFKIYLLISVSDKTFRLCNKITENIELSKNDKRKVNRGKRLESYSPKDLNIILIYLLHKISYILFFNIKKLFNIKNFNIIPQSKKIELIKYILFINKMYLIH